VGDNRWVCDDDSCYLHDDRRIHIGSCWGLTAVRREEISRLGVGWAEQQQSGERHQDETSKDEPYFHAVSIPDSGQADDWSATNRERRG
jgi:hypothetical protein